MAERISYAEAVEILRCHISAIPKMIRRGELHSVRRRGGSLDRAEVEALAEQRQARREEIASRKGRRRRVDPRPDTEHEWLRATDVAEVLGISAQSVRQSLRRGSLPGVWSHGKWWMRADQLELVRQARLAQGLQGSGLVRIVDDGTRMSRIVRW